MKKILHGLSIGLFLMVLSGCAIQHIPPSYYGYKPSSPLPFTAALYFHPFEDSMPLALTKYKYKFPAQDFSFSILYGLTTVVTVTSASEHLFSKCFELRTTKYSKQIAKPEIENLFAEYIEIKESMLINRLKLCKTHNIDVLVDISVLEYIHSSEEATMTLSWTLYDVKTLKQIIQKQVQIQLPNTADKVFLYWTLKENINKNLELCEQLVAACVEKMVKSINFALSDESFIKK